MNKKAITDACPAGEDRLKNEFLRRDSRQIAVGDVLIGGGAPIAVQSMTKTDTQDVERTVAEIRRLENAGCEIIRCAVPDGDAASALKDIKESISIPLIADIHFDHRLALASIEQGVDGLRINPGNIGSKKKVRDVVVAAKERAVPIRIGVNAGSLEKDLLQRFGEASAEAMVESGLRHVRILEELNFNLIKISLKASDISRTLDAYQLMAEKVDYPFHAGITEAGTIVSGAVKSSAGMALLLREGLVDTFRVSLTAPPEEEVRIAYLILSSLGLRSRGLNFVSCPICGRCEVDLMPIANEIERELLHLKKNITVAVMGCMVNGPGEAKEADIGLACGKGVGVVFKKGKLHRRLKEGEIVPEFIADILALHEES